MDYNKITQLSFLKTSSTSNIRYLSVKYNRISIIEGDEVNHMNLLWYLDIRGNLISDFEFALYMTGLLAMYFGKNPIPPTESLVLPVSNMETLDFIQSNVEKFPLLSASKASILKINGGWNEIVCIDVPHMSDMILLETLLLSNNKIHKFPDNGCASDDNGTFATGDWSFPSLKIFDITSNLLTEFPILPSAGTSSSSLDIDLSQNRISNFSTEHLKFLKNATNLKLVVSNNLIKDMPRLNAVGQALVYVNLELNEIAYLSHEHLAGLVNLETFRAAHNRITGVPLFPNELQNTLITVTLENNPFVCDSMLCSRVTDALKISGFTCVAPLEFRGLGVDAAYSALDCILAPNACKYHMHVQILHYITLQL